MAKVNVVADAVVVTSGLKLKDIKMVEKYRPESLVLKGEDGKEPIFKVSSGVKASLNRYGVVFTGETRDEDKLATLTLVGIFDEEADVAELIADNFGSALMMLNKLEASIPEIVAEISAEREAIMDAITVA